MNVVAADAAPGRGEGDARAQVTGARGGHGNRVLSWNGTRGLVGL